eukprot:CAMPEP_0119560690 /NCGR_PEP_ID=MMETSP1352-20130426/15667_1 /TAXON_ID=265584 /ORGANISM="Stauroneis constricta, Strain CCMP1120" /LENGTH=760 /DNA_ID=CAMNT_0007608739 /DNA_START=72 /DNA_END=2354 /DNA_ORIENTATION=+
MKFALLTVAFIATTHAFSGPSSLSLITSSTTRNKQVVGACRTFARQSVLPLAANKKNKVPEYTVVEDDEEEEDYIVDDDDGAVVEGETSSYMRLKHEAVDESEAPVAVAPAVAKRQRPEYAALPAGTVLQVQVGDVSLARKAWKKRRRSGSPLLVPCSVLNVDRQSMVRWNLIFLLEKFGRARKDGVAMDTKELSAFYRSYLQRPLSDQLEALGYETVDDMTKGLFTTSVQESYGVRLVEHDKDGETVIELRAPIARRKAQARAAKAPLLQFRKFRSGDHGDADTLTHTGYIRARDEDAEDHKHVFLPLSAALRVSQKDDVDTGRVFEDSIHAAVVFDYDVQGDGGSPLLTLSLNPGGTRDNLKIKPDTKLVPIENPKVMLKDLAVGDGPYKAKVVHIRPGRALVDCQVGRHVASEGIVRVMGTLRFQDSVQIDPSAIFSDQMMDSYVDDEDEMDDLIEGTIDELDFSDEDEDDEEYDDDDDDNDNDDYADGGDDDDDAEEGDLAEQLLSLRDSSTFEEGTFEEDEEVEDITDLFQLGEDGNLIYNDPESGEPIAVDGDGDNDDDDLEEEEDTSAKAQKSNGFAKPSNGNKEPLFFQHKPNSFSSVKIAPVARPHRLKRKMLNVGDEVDVYIRSVSQQSSQFSVTTNGAAVQGKSQKDMKKEENAEKRLKRLTEKLGSLERIWALEGKTCTGTVRALSKCGDGMYVQPELDVPTGVATIGDGVAGPFAIGDTVAIRIDGIDEERGQVALTVIDGSSDSSN